MQEFIPKCDFPVFEQQNGLFVLNKPSGPSSARCLSIFKKLGQKKVGHAGTLDPFAQGVLLALLGHATKLSGYIMEGGEKTYKGILQLGIETDTWDLTGRSLREASFANIPETAIISEAAAWLNLTDQEVPPFSAAKHNGRPLYKLARKGIDTPVKIKKINVSKVEVLNISLPYVTFRVSCSSGSYIRSLAHSLGTRLGCGATLTELSREYSYPFNLSQATGINELQGKPELLRSKLFPVEAALPDWPLVELSEEECVRVKNGMTIPCRNASSEKAILRHERRAIALGCLDFCGHQPVWKVLRGLWN